MLSFQEFRTSLLLPLLKQDYPTLGALADTPLTMFAARLDHPLDFIFESASWAEVSGASQRVARAAEKLGAILATDGYAADSLLHGDSGSVWALVHDPKIAERWVELIERSVALETELLTVSTGIQPITPRQLLDGLYRAPESVIGVPGVNDYQMRINRYYGLDSPSTVPNAEALARRRHFGEVTARMHGLLGRAQDSHEVFPFYEALPFAERCAVCRKRPAERIDQKPICGLCSRNRAASKGDRLDNAALIMIEAVDLLRALEGLRSPSVYRAYYADIDETLRAAMPERFKARTLFASQGRIWLAISAGQALEAAVTALEAIAVHYNQRPPVGFTAAVALGNGPDRLDALYHLVLRTAEAMRHETPTMTGISLDLRFLDEPFDRFRKPYRLDEARRLLAGVDILREAALPDGLLADLPAQIVRGSAGLYYAFERSSLPDSAQSVFSRLEQVLNFSPATSARFHSMLGDGLALVRLSRPSS